MLEKYPPYYDVEDDLYMPYIIDKPINPITTHWTFVRREGFKLVKIRSTDRAKHGAVEEVRRLNRRRLTRCPPCQPRLIVYNKLVFILVVLLFSSL